jgi:dipeptidyl aminopeptidase/acylaminoacyl peptidase
VNFFNRTDQALLGTGVVARVDANNTVVLAGALQSQKVPVEVHLYPNGGHGYGLRPDKTKQVTSWPERCADWMRNRGIIR